MPKLKKSFPNYCKHKASGQAIVTLNGRDFYLGPHGTAASRREYDRLLTEWLGAGRTLAFLRVGVSVGELLLAFLKHAKTYYRHADGTASTEITNYIAVAAVVRTLHGREPVDEFGPLKLQSVMAKMIEMGWVRSRINRELARIKHIFRWGTAQELVPGEISHALAAVDGLRRGRSEAGESEPVKPVEEAAVLATLPHLGRHIRAMVEVQLLTGMRPGEVCTMTPGEIDRAGPVWKYRPTQHKNAHHGHDRVILIGPKAQDILRPYLLRPADRPIFSPQEADAEFRAVKSAARKTRLSCGNRPGRRKANRKRPIGDRYDVAAYRRAIARACKAAAVPSWHPHQLRHTAATKIRNEFGIEAAQVVLGHATLRVTELYAEKNQAAAAEVMRKIG